MGKRSKKSLKQRLRLLTGMNMVPFIILVFYLIAALISFGNSYNQVAKNISLANNYNMTFWKDMDYSLYRIVIGSKTFESIQEEQEEKKPYGWEEIKDPYLMLKNAREGFQNLIPVTRDKENQYQLQWIIKSLNLLERKVAEIEDNIKKKGLYSENMKLLDEGIYVLTDNLQEDIQKYVYYEAQNLEQIRSELEQKQQEAVALSIYGLIFILVANFIVSRRITSSVTKPIQELCMATEQVAKGDFTSPTEIESGDEISVLTYSFNTMKGEIGHLIEDIKEEQNNLRATELKLLQAQINPHFLYNTLDTIVWLAEGKQTKQVVEMVTSLSEFFRTVLSEGKDYITIKEEKAHIHSYLSIQQFRYQDILEYKIEIEESLYQYSILKLTLQPLVENALYHGIKNQRGKGKITVLGKQEGDEIVLQVIDNGIGMTLEELEHLRKQVKREIKDEKRGFGLANVEERIRLNYGTQYGLSFESILTQGTVATVRIPAQRL